MKKTLISFNWAIQGVLREKANFNILSGFFSELLGRRVEIQDLLESQSNADRVDDKTNNLDLKAKIDGGEIVVFELQVNSESDFYHRILFGASTAVKEQLHKGDHYGKIKKVYAIDIVYFELGKGSDYIYRGVTDFRGVHNNEELLLSETEMKFLPQSAEGAQNAGALFPEYYIIYPNRFKGPINNGTDQWVSVLKTSEVDSSFTAAGIQEAGEALDERRMTEAERIRYEAFIKSERIKWGEIDSAKLEGKAEGLAEGEAKGRAEGEAKGRAEGERQKAAEIAKNLKSIGIPDSQITAATGLSAEEISRI